jgi:hypothetical protein
MNFAVQVLIISNLRKREFEILALCHKLLKEEVMFDSCNDISTQCACLSSHGILFLTSICPLEKIMSLVFPKTSGVNQLNVFAYPLMESFPNKYMPVREDNVPCVPKNIRSEP